MQQAIILLVFGASLLVAAVGCFTGAIYYGVADFRKPTVITITAATPDIDLTAWNRGVAFTSNGMLTWDPNKYDLKVVERKQKD